MPDLESLQRSTSERLEEEFIALLAEIKAARAIASASDSSADPTE